MTDTVVLAQHSTNENISENTDNGYCLRDLIQARKGMSAQSMRKVSKNNKINNLLNFLNDLFKNCSHNKQMDYANLGKYIKDKRETQKISLNKFCIANDIEPAILSRIENQKQGIKLNSLIKIASGFKMTLAEFLTEFENA